MRLARQDDAHNAADLETLVVAIAVLLRVANHCHCVRNDGDRRERQDGVLVADGTAY